MLLAVALHVVLSFQPAPLLSQAALRAALEEASRIWSRYGVAVVATTDSSRSASRETAIISVTPAASRHLTYDDAHGIGALDFSDGGEPQPHITIDYVGLVRMTRGLTLLGKKAGQWPVALREQTVGRVLGRILAHEVGHFLLASRGHAKSGLMRAAHHIADLADPHDASYHLDDVDVSRIQAAAVAAAGGPGGE